MTDIRAFIGAPLNFKNKLNIYPPSIREVVTNPKFSIYSKILTITQEDIQDELKKSDEDIEYRLDFDNPKILSAVQNNTQKKTESITQHTHSYKYSVECVGHNFHKRFPIQINDSSRYKKRKHVNKR